MPPSQQDSSATESGTSAERVRFWDRIADKYAAKPVPDEAVYAEKLRITREYLTPDSMVVEYGAGTGSTAIAQAPHVKEILAADISPRMIEIAREKAAAAGVGNVTFQISAVEDMTVPRHSADVVMAHSILHLVDDCDAVIAQSFEMLKPGGVFISSTACLGTWKMAWFRLIAPVGRIIGLFPPVRIFSAQALSDKITRTGFAVERSWQPGGGLTLFLVARKPDIERPFDQA